MSEAPLRIAFLTYRGNPRCGGQGVYTRHLTREIAALGHDVEVWSGQPYPALDAGVPLLEIPSLDLWNEEHFLRVPTLRELRDPLNVMEWLLTCTGGFPEPRTFTRRVLRRYRSLPATARYDVVHDNQSLGTALLELEAMVPIVGTIHHPITVDRRIAIRSAPSFLRRLGLRRWYSFIPMQKRVARQLAHVITVSDVAAADIQKEFDIERRRLHVVPCGVDLDVFRPLDNVLRQENRLITTVSGNVPLKGFYFLLEALAAVRRERPSVTLTVVGSDGNPETIRRLRSLDLNDAVRFTGWVTTEQLVELYAEATVAVVPSLYEGFGLPAAEAMACQVPVVSTHGGALPEVIGSDGAAGILVPPGQSESLARPIAALLDAPERRLEMGAAGRKRVTSLFTWQKAAQQTVEVYRQAIAERRAAC
jgi:glycosyltransferase involved in cell wall biosynthesis